MSSLRPDVDPGISDWVGGLLAKEPADRTPSAAVASDELDETLHGLLGHRWRRDAALPVLVATAPLTRAFASTPPTRVITPTARWTQERTAERTLPPAAEMAMPEPEQHERPRGRVRPFPLIVAAFVLIAALAAIAGTVSGGSGSPATAVPSTTVAPQTSGDAATTTPTAAPTSANPANPPNPSNPSNPSNPPNTNNTNNADSGSSVGDSGNSGSSGDGAASDGGNSENSDDGGDDGTSAANP